MTIRFIGLGILAVCGFLVTATAAQAIAIRNLPGIAGVAVYEASGAVSLFNMLPTGSVITTRLADRLSAGNTDYNSPANEFYDFFYSDADGTFNAFGEFLTITAIFDGPPDSGLNINRAFLSLPSGQEWASYVASFEAYGTTPLPATVTNALGNTAGTTTFLGDTAGQADNVRLRLTLGFDSTGARQIPAPGALALFAAGLAGLAWARRRRRI
jgi:hypothetical protein